MLLPWQYSEGVEQWWEGLNVPSPCSEGGHLKFPYGDLKYFNTSYGGWRSEIFVTLRPPPSAPFNGEGGGGLKYIKFLF